MGRKLMIKTLVLLGKTRKPAVAETCGGSIKNSKQIKHAKRILEQLLKSSFFLTEKPKASFPFGRILS